MSGWTRTSGWLSRCRVEADDVPVHDARVDEDLRLVEPLWTVSRWWQTILREYPEMEADDIRGCLRFAHRAMAGERVYDRFAVREVW